VSSLPLPTAYKDSIPSPKEKRDPSPSSWAPFVCRLQSHLPPPLLTGILYTLHCGHLLKTWALASLQRQTDTEPEWKATRNSWSRLVTCWRHGTHAFWELIKLKIPWPESASELYRPSDRRLSAKLVPTFADIGCHVVRVTNPYGRNLGFLDRSRYIFFQAAPQLYSLGWVNPVPDPLLLRKSGSAWNRTRTSGSVARNSGH
jgi:hypothetical protein